VRGKCRICGSYDQLTYEHVPPRSALNSSRQHLYSGDSIINLIESDRLPWEFSGLKWEQKQRGIGFKTLCARCNNDTGAWYADAFSDFVLQAFREIARRRLTHKSVERISLYEIYPLRIIKQIVAMFCSINDANMLETYPELRAFLLNKERKGLAADDFRISLYLTIGEIGKYIGRAVIMKRKEDGEIQNLAVSELSFPPFGSVLQFEPYSDNDIPGLYCINFFANNFNYDEAVSINLELPVLECNTQYPCDFRTKEQIISNFDLD